MQRLCMVCCALLLAAAPSRASEAPFTRDDARAVIGNLRKIVTPRGIEESRSVDINGTRQWISVRGRDRDNPILLFLHGGPAAPEMPTAWTFQGPWEDYFTVVQWDQRGAGKTYNANDPAKIAPTMTLAQMNDDVDAMVRHLLAAYGRKKIFVLGHSWGSILGLSLARRHPEWLYAYVGMGQVIDPARAEHESYLAALAEARARGDATAIRELGAIAPYPGKDGSLPLDKIDIERKWSVKFGGLAYGRDSYAFYYRAGRLSPDYGDADFEAIDKGSELSLPKLLPAMAATDFEDATEFRCPIVMFEGRHDETTPSGVAEEWFGRVRAPAKKWVWFENSAHLMQIEEPGRVLVHLVEDVLPLAR
ncbi:MAG TPA: alpha/beta hydrolase [Rhizomicrobium sp.]|nr:alpha/beta hydrolase [Rhizomicrobium sp.]